MVKIPLLRQTTVKRESRERNKAKRILVAEDERPIARALELKLKNLKFDVDIAFDGEEAMGQLKKKKYDLLILDLVMPKMDGFAVLEAMKRAGITLPVIVSSNLSQNVDAERVKAFGVTTFFVKSESTIADVVRYVNEVLQQ